MSSTYYHTTYGPEREGDVTCVPDRGSNQESYTMDAEGNAVRFIVRRPDGSTRAAGSAVHVRRFFKIGDTVDRLTR